MKRATLILAVLSQLLGNVGQAKAGFIYSQPLDNTKNSGAFSGLIGQNAQQVADNFTLPSNATVGGVEWFGSYFGNGTSPIGTNNQTSLRFNISIHADQNGLPSTTVGIDTLITAAATDTGMLSPDGDEVYMFSANPIFLPFALLGGQQYWISIFNNNPGLNTFIDRNSWQWASSNTPNGSSAVSIGNGARNWMALTGDEAFTLFLTPEPGSLFLLASGLAGLAGITWRRHRRK